MAYKVLTVDDEAFFTTLIKMNLEKEGEFVVRVENNPNQAVYTALEFKPDVILMDIVMPGMDGGDVVAQFQNYPELKNIPVIMMTALMSPDEAGDDGFAQSLSQMVLPKPVNVQTLKRCLKKVVGAA
jgi:CheY-like chemotaxis protein